MQKIVEAPRDEIREAVVAFFRRQWNEKDRIERRLFELTGLSYDLQEEKYQDLPYLLVELYVDNLMGIISEEEFIVKQREVGKEYIIMKKKEEGRSPEERELISKGFIGAYDSLGSYLGAGHLEKRNQYWQEVFKLARDRGVAPKDVFDCDELYKEFIRSVYTPEEYKAKLSSGFNQFNLDTFFEILVKPGVEAMLENDEIAKEYLNELKEKVASSPEFQAFNNASEQIVKEEVERIYG